MHFDSLKFFSGFLDYLRQERADTLAYASVIAAPEAWVQFEALGWLHRNRESIGLKGGDRHRPLCDVAAETKKNDIWLQDTEGSRHRSGAALELKAIYNNKNFKGQVWSLRNDMSVEKAIPDGFEAVSVQRFGLAILIYVRYLRGSDGGYQVMAGSRRGQPCSPDEFLAAFGTECGSSDPRYENTPTVVPLLSHEFVVSLDDQPYIDPDFPGCGVWMSLVKAQ